MLVQIVGLLLASGFTEAAQVLVQPYAYGMSSRFKDHVKLAEVLVNQGHNVTVLVNTDQRKYIEQTLPVRNNCYIYPTVLYIALEL